MYKDVGKELKGWAKFLVILLTIPYIILGIIIIASFASNDQGGLGVFVAIVVAVLGYFLARMGAILLYAFGEIVDCVSTIKNCVCGNPGAKSTKKEKVQQKDVETVEKHIQAPTVERSADGSWKCLFCGQENPAGADWCEGCGVQANPK